MAYFIDTARWIDEGSARVEPDGEVSWVYLHSLPIGRLATVHPIVLMGTHKTEPPAVR